MRLQRGQTRQFMSCHHCMRKDGGAILRCCPSAFAIRADMRHATFEFQRGVTKLCSSAAGWCRTHVVTKFGCTAATPELRSASSLGAERVGGTPGGGVRRHRLLGCGMSTAESERRPVSCCCSVLTASADAAADAVASCCVCFKRSAAKVAVPVEAFADGLSGLRSLL